MRVVIYNLIKNLKINRMGKYYPVNMELCVPISKDTYLNLKKYRCSISTLVTCIFLQIIIKHLH